jgi:glucosamine kinase
MAYLIADSGATKCEWCLVHNNKKTTIITNGISPYFLNQQQIIALLQTDLLPKINIEIESIFFYGTGLSNADNVKMIKACLKKTFLNVVVEVNTDLVAAARSLLQNQKGIACILGTGSNSGYYNGKKIAKNTPSLGYILGDEGSGAYLGKKIIQHYLYNTFDQELVSLFNQKFAVSQTEILNNVYKQPQANKYLAAFTVFLSENRGHYMIENIIEDGLHDFFFNHLYKYRETWQQPISFTGSVAFAFKDVLKTICNENELQLGNVTKQPMEGLILFHSK